MVTTLMQIIHCVVVNPSASWCKTPAIKHAKIHHTIHENRRTNVKKSSMSTSTISYLRDPSCAGDDEHKWRNHPGFETHRTNRNKKNSYRGDSPSWRLLVPDTVCRFLSSNHQPRHCRPVGVRHADNPETCYSLCDLKKKYKLLKIPSRIGEEIPLGSISEKFYLRKSGQCDASQ